MATYFATTYHENGRRLYPAAQHAHQQDARQEILWHLRLNPRAASGTIWRYDPTGHGAGKFIKVQDVPRPPHTPRSIDPYGCSDEEWVAWLEETDRRNGRGS